MKRFWSCGFVFVVLMTPVQAESPASLRAGTWRAWLDSPGGELPFGLQLIEHQGQWQAAILNGAERMEIPIVQRQGDELILAIPHYDSIIKAKSSADGSRLDGEWKKRSKGDRVVGMPFHADAGEGPRFSNFVDRPAMTSANPPALWHNGLNGRWRLQFAGDPDPAVLILEASNDGQLSGTVLTTTGDYRFLVGAGWHFRSHPDPPLGGVRLSTFDGAHAFLFRAAFRTEDDVIALAGDFWSGDTFHDTWIAKRDPDAQLPDAFTLTKAMESAKLDQVVFPDLQGQKRSLADPAFAGKARVIEIFGTWCPNCNDASKYLAELHGKYKGRGLSILGLAFEYSGDTQRDTEQVQAFVKHHKLDYSILLAGTSDREKASASLPIIDKLRAYPTLLVLDRNNKIQATYTGFSGPATGEEYQRFRSKFEALIEKLLAD